MPLKYDEITKKKLEQMLRERIIKLAHSPWDFPVVAAQKSDGRPRVCVGFWALNKRMKVEKFPIPNVEEVIESLADANVFSKLDMFAGYWQIQLAEHFQEMTTFTCKNGSFLFVVVLMPAGLMNVPAMF